MKNLFAFVGIVYTGSKIIGGAVKFGELVGEVRAMRHFVKVSKRLADEFIDEESE